MTQRLGDHDPKQVGEEASTSHSASTGDPSRCDVGEMLAAIVAAHWTHLVTFAEAVVGQDRALAEDCVQDALLAVYRTTRARELTSPELHAYVTRAVRNASLSSRRRQRPGGDPALAALADPTPSPFEYTVGRELRVAVRRAVAELPPAHRQALMLSRYEGKSRDEIATAMCVSPHTVSNYVNLAMKRVRHAIREHLGP